MKRHLTEHLAELADPALAGEIAPGEGFEVIVGGVAVRWRQTAAPEQAGDGCIWRLAQPDGPLRAEVFLRTDSPHRAASYHVELSNAGGSEFVVGALYPLVVRFPRLNGPWRTLTAGGGTTENFYPPRAYRTRERVVFGGEVRIESPPGGRSSNRHLPLMLATAGAEPDAPGLFCGMEYSGEWFLTLRHVGDSPFLRGMLKMRDVALAAGERLALPAVHVGFYGGGLAGGTNALRRYVRDCIFPGGGAAAETVPAGPLPPVNYNTWFGIGNKVDEATLGPQVARAAELGCEAWVHDAGWFEGGFPRGVGNWHRADPAKYPRGLKPLADAVRSAGMKFGLWFEIERAEEGTWAIENHRELFFPPQPTWAGNSYHLDLARPDGRDWAFQILARWIDELGLEWLKLDYNIEPAPYFHAADASGKMQLAYCDGLYGLLEGLAGEYPGLVIEGCASGGRRIDLGTLRRTHVTWMSDHSFHRDICRYMQCRFARFLPGNHASLAVCVYPGGAGSFEDVDVVSRMCGALCFHGHVASWPRPLARRIRRWVDAYKRIRHLLVEDAFELLPTPTSDRDWDAVQFAAADGAASAVFAFRMAGEQERAKLHLRRIDPEAVYTVTNLARPGRSRKLAGADLARGLPVTLKPNSAACIECRKTGTRD